MNKQDFEILRFPVFRSSVSDRPNFTMTTEEHQEINSKEQMSISPASVAPTESQKTESPIENSEIHSGESSPPEKLPPIKIPITAAKNLENNSNSNNSSNKRRSSVSSSLAKSKSTANDANFMALEVWQELKNYKDEKYCSFALINFVADVF
jgi:hypothetical protein